MASERHNQLYGLSSGLAKPHYSLDLNCNVDLSHALVFLLIVPVRVRDKIPGWSQRFVCIWLAYVRQRCQVAHYICQYITVFSCCIYTNGENKLQMDDQITALCIKSSLISQKMFKSGLQSMLGDFEVMKVGFVYSNLVLFHNPELICVIFDL